MSGTRDSFPRPLAMHTAHGWSYRRISARHNRRRIRREDGNSRRGEVPMHRHGAASEILRVYLNRLGGAAASRSCSSRYGAALDSVSPSRPVDEAIRPLL